MSLSEHSPLRNKTEVQRLFMANLQHISLLKNPSFIRQIEAKLQVVMTREIASATGASRFSTMALISNTELDHLDTLGSEIAGTLSTFDESLASSLASPENHALSMMTFMNFSLILRKLFSLAETKCYFTGGRTVSCKRSA